MLAEEVLSKIYSATSRKNPIFHRHIEFIPSISRREEIQKIITVIESIRYGVSG